MGCGVWDMGCEMWSVGCEPRAKAQPHLELAAISAKYVAYAFELLLVQRYL